MLPPIDRSPRTWARQLLIDDSGGVRPVKHEAIVHRVGTLRRRADVAAHAVALGFIFVDMRAVGTRIALRPEFITRRAIARLALLIAGPIPLRIALSCDGAMRSWEVVVGPGAAIARIDAVVAEALQPQPRALLTHERLSLDRLGDVSRGRLLPMLQIWEAAQHRWSPLLMERWEEAGCLEHTIIVRSARRSERLIVEHWGKRRGVYGSQWPRIAFGRDFEEQPNSDVGVWRSAMLRQANAAGQAHFGVDDAVMRLADGRLVRFSTHRLILPWQTVDGDLLCEITAGRRVVTLERLAPAN